MNYLAEEFGEDEEAVGREVLMDVVIYFYESFAIFCLKVFESLSLKHF